MAQIQLKQGNKSVAAQRNTSLVSSTYPYGLSCGKLTTLLTEVYLIPLFTNVLITLTSISRVTMLTERSIFGYEFGTVLHTTYVSS